ncbi:restriction endonuclease subunit S [Staphylococcus haemolyticus]|uniref:restriction endonuclease subunit S n=1 Tax=Staphylococcus haemolyticus TaxID=1283 RepID=UPI0034D739AB
MSNTQKNVPELRFPGFENGWSLKRFKDIFVFHNNLRKPIKENLRVKGSYPYYGATGIIDYVDDYIFEGNYILIGEDGANIITRSAPLVYLAKGKFWVNNHAHILTPLNGNIQFLYQVAELVNYEKYNTGTAQPKLNIQNLKNISVNISTDLEEQQKIGDFFSKLDRQIELEEEKLELLEQQKKGYMQKLFSQDLRFKDENGNSYPEWSIKKIEDISKVNKGFTPNTKNDEYWDELNENWLSIAGMTQKYLYKGNKGITKKGASKHAKVDKDTLIMSFKLTLGKLAIVKEPIYTNEAICHFVWKESNVNTEYMYYYLNSINISTFGAQAVKGVTLNNDSINSIIVKLPVIQEQNKIAYFFNKLDKLIEKQSSKVESLKQRKKGLLQKMFV